MTEIEMNTLLLYIAAAFLLAFAFYYIIPLKFRWIVLLCVSLGFYVAMDLYLIVFAITTAIGVYFSARGIQRRNDKLAAQEEVTDEDKKKVKKLNKASIVVTILFNLAVLGFLKYFNFFGEAIFSFLNLFKAGVTFRALKLFLPLGISFYTLSAIGYLVDVHRKKYVAEKNFFKILTFLTFFPSIVEGPIMRYDQDGKQILEGHKAEYKNIAHGAQRVMWGLFKKLVIADRVYLVVKTISEAPTKYSGLASLFFILGYTLQLYADFSGFMDIALGLAEMFGIKLTENFRQPFFAKGPQEFWQRWHITLGLWFKEYIFYSVALTNGMKKFSKAIKKKHKNHFTKTLPTIIALFCVWFSNGLWHGPEWKYIVYGLYYFVIIAMGMMMEPLWKKMWEKMKVNPNAVWLNIFRHLRTLLIIFVGETIFGANNLKDAFYILGSVFTPYKGSLLGFGLDWKEVVVLVVAVAVLIVVDTLKEKKIDIQEGLDACVLPVRWAVYLSMIVAVVIFGAYGSAYTGAPFMYGGF